MGFGASMSEADYFLNSKANVVQLETLEISHSAFSQTYYIVRNAVRGITANDEEGNEIDFVYRPVSMDPPDVTDDLDQILGVSLGDLGTIISKELKNVLAEAKENEYPICKYRTYRSDDLSQPMLGPLLFQIQTVSMKPGGATFQAKVPSLNNTRTGERYTRERFSMLDYLL
jgi:hypothetical protein